jgi:hypothetical protein
MTPTSRRRGDFLFAGFLCAAEELELCWLRGFGRSLLYRRTRRQGIVSRARDLSLQCVPTHVFFLSLSLSPYEMFGVQCSSDAICVRVWFSAMSHIRISFFIRSSTPDVDVAYSQVFSKVVLWCCFVFSGLRSQSIHEHLILAPQHSHSELREVEFFLLGLFRLLRLLALESLENAQMHCDGRHSLEEPRVSRITDESEREGDALCLPIRAPTRIACIRVKTFDDSINYNVR